MPVNITDVDAFTDPITAPDDGDAASGANFQSPIQKLANRTYFLLNKIWVATPATVVRWVGAGYQISSDAAVNNPGWLHFYSSPGVAISVGAARAKILIPLDHALPNGCTITQVRVRVDPLAAQAVAGNRMSAQVFVNDSTGSISSSTETTTDATNAAQWITISGLSIVVDKATRSYAVAVLNSLDYAGDQLFGVEVTFTSSKKFVD